MVSERTFDWLVALPLEDLLDLPAWIGHVLRLRLLGTVLVYQDVRELLNPLAQHPNRRVRPRVDRAAGTESSNYDTSPEP